VRRKFFALIASVLLLALVVSYNNCTNNTIFQKVYGTTGTGNPMISNELLFAVCGTITRCNQQVTMDLCRMGVLSAPGMNGPLGLPSSYPTLYAISQGEQSGTLIGGVSGGDSCFTNINDLPCTDPRVQGAYNSLSPNPFLGASGVVPASACSDAFAPASQYACSTKVFLRGVSGFSVGPRMTGPGLTYSVSPPLPAGLTLDSATGVISGTSTNVTPMTSFTVTAASSNGVTSSVVSIRTADGYLVDSTADAADVAPGDKKCATSAGSCTLRAAISEINSSMTPNVVVLPPGQITLSAGELLVTKPADIYGDCVQNTIVDGNSAGGIFHVTAAGNTSFNNLVIQNGLTSSDGAGLLLDSPSGNMNVVVNQSSFVNNVNSGGSLYGGAVATWLNGSPYTAILTLSNSIFRGNTATNTSGGAIYSDWLTTLTVTGTTFRGNSAGNGGAIRADGPATITQSTFMNNVTSGYGGAFYSNSNLKNVMINDTFFSNSASRGGALALGAAGSFSIVNSTIANNSASIAGGVGGVLGTSQYLNSIVFSNTDPNGRANCGGGVTSSGSNISDTDVMDCAFNSAGDQLNTNPILGPLQDNGGPTATMALLPNSPAIDGGTKAGCPAIDQRGFLRPVNGVCDIGAFEIQW
jgi:CSLREA domain-containing protein